MISLALPHSLPERLARLMEPVLADKSLRESKGAKPRAGWDVTTSRLDEWRNDPQQLADEDVEPPTGEVLADALEIAALLSEDGFDPPDVVVPDGDGGLAFRWRAAEQVWTIELDRDGWMESYLQHRGKLVWRHALHDVAEETT